jgi:hypothetical protein
MLTHADACCRMLPVTDADVCPLQVGVGVAECPQVLSLLASLLLYWYKSTHTDAAEWLHVLSAWRGMRGGCFSLLALLVQEYKYCCS